MGVFLLKRLLFSAGVVLIVSFLIFALVRAIPTSPALLGPGS